jgi:hypothetical protein
VNTLIKRRIPMGSEPSSDEDPTGVRALLSSLPEPEPMPAHLVDRINASLAAEQAQRAAKASNTPLAGLLTHRRSRHGRLIFAIVGAAAAVVVLAFIGNNLFSVHQNSAISGSAAITSTSDRSRAAGPDLPPAAARAPGLAGGIATPSLVQITSSGIRYTQADFIAQVQALRRAPVEPMAGRSSSSGPAGTAVGLTRCLSAIGAGEAQVVRADIGFYQGQPAVIIVATTNGLATAYAVGRQCSQTDAVVLRPATPLS